ncbi:cytochrome P450 [Massilia eurypsychrophila]|uniref:Cytochrome P450 n=1 Tax=Massilia eurypsychrophila TaxID=1485217 RepID=A0A2G8T9Y0_9BURK|nr:cytochrome P450 [Massilia eurypsychrophila]PIL42822.1 cytochrome P450 [Massilia eurypsychrophila]
MKPSSSSKCPYAGAADQHAAVAPTHSAGEWPPGPAAGLTGWGLLRRMSKDLLGTVTEWRRRHGDIVHVRIWPERQIVVSEPQLVRDLLVNHHERLIRWERGVQVFSQLHGQSVLTTEGDLWKSKRQALHGNFTPKTVQSYVPAIASAAAKAFSQWQGGDEDYPVESALTSLAMDVILRMMFSSEADEDARIAERAVHDTARMANSEMYWPASWPDWMPWKASKRRGINVLNRMIDRYIQARLLMPPGDWPEDMLSRLLILHRDDPVAWPLKAVHDECMTTFLAGHETSAATLTWWTWCMAANADTQAAARQEVQDILQGRVPTATDLPKLSYLIQTLQETLRLYPAVPVLMSRRAVGPISLGQWQLPARTMFMVPVQLMHHDPRWFPDPLTFFPQRFSAGAPDIPRGAFMPFGAGPRVCLGQHLAMTEMIVIAAMLLQRFAVKVPAGTSAPEPVFNITLRPSQKLCLTLSELPG